jgi:O-antigen ligase
VPSADDEVVPTSTARRQRRWGLRLLAMLALAFVSLLGLGGDYPLLATLGLIAGLAGGAYCSYRGLKGFSWLPR